MNARDEYRRLSDLASTPKGWEKIETLWMRASNYEKRGGGWQKISGSGGNTICGFAIDKRSWEYRIGRPGYEHFKAAQSLRFELQDKVNTVEEYEEVKRSVIDARLGKVEGWVFPLIHIWTVLSLKEGELEVVEEKILDLDIGLPLNRLWNKFCR